MNLLPQGPGKAHQGEMKAIYLAERFGYFSLVFGWRSRKMKRENFKAQNSGMESSVSTPPLDDHATHQKIQRYATMMHDDT
jgi:hypothetical protein